MGDHEQLALAEALAFEYWACDQPTTWQSWQALAACTYSEVVAFRQLLTVWPTITTGYAALVDHHITPSTMMRVLELAVHEGCLTPQVAQTVEEALLARVNADGVWKP